MGLDSFLFLRGMLGPAAAAQVNQDGGQSVHRRSLNDDGTMTDCHIRLTDLELSTGNYDSSYLGQLGSELAYIGHDVFQDAVKAIATAVTVHDPDGPPLGGCPLYSDDKRRPELTMALQTTVLSTIFRNHMGKTYFYYLMGLLRFGPVKI